MKSINLIIVIMIVLLSFVKENKAQTWQTNEFQYIDTMLTYNCDLIVVADKGLLGRELYKYDGDTITLVADINPGVIGGTSNNLIEFNNELIFIGNDGIHGNELYKYDGSSVSMIIDFFAGTNEGFLTYGKFFIYNNELYLYGGASGGIKLYKYDGNTISIVSPGVDVSMSIKPISYNNELYFCGRNGSLGYELYKYNGNVSSLVLDLNVGTSNGFIPYNNQVTVYNSELIFVGDDGVNGEGLYKYNGNTVSFITNLLQGISGPGFIDMFKATIYNNAFYYMCNGAKLYKYDGNTTSLVGDINPGLTITNPYYSILKEYNGELIFSGVNSTTGSELYKYDGSTISLIVDLYPGSLSGVDFYLSEYNSELFFTGNNGVTGKELYKYDGAAVSLAAEYVPGNSGLPSSSSYRSMEISKCELFFRSYNRLYSYNSTVDMSNCGCNESPCTDYVSTNTPNGIYLVTGDTTFNYDSTLNQNVLMEIYGNFNSWDLTNNHQADQTYFQVNGTDSVSLETIYNNLPYTLNGVVITIDTTDLNVSNTMGSWTSGTLIFTGNIDHITMIQFESGIVKICKELNEEVEQECIDYVTSTTPDGVYLVTGDTTFNYDSTLNQNVSMGIYGNFNGWDLTNNHQADQTYFQVNGTDSVSLETIYNNLPYTLNGVVITIDTTGLNVSNTMGSWTSGTLIFTGNIDHITMIQFESGIVKICKELNEDCGCLETPCPCNIDAEFTYTNNGHSYNFLSAATGTEYEWNFGDGESSTIDNPYHLFSTPGVYEVCLTNYNLTDSCTITVCDSIVVACQTPNANIITPNQDGMDDYIALNCGNVNVYNRNGLLVVTLTNETVWDGTDANQNLVPMGEYVLLCADTNVAMNVTVIR